MTLDFTKRIIAAVMLTVVVLPALLGWITVRRVRRAQAAEARIAAREAARNGAETSQPPTQ